MPPPNNILNKGGPHIKPAQLEIAELICSNKFSSLSLKSLTTMRLTTYLLILFNDKT